MNGTELLIQILFTFIFAAVLVGWFTWPVSRANAAVEATRWARAHSLELTARNRAMVSYYVQLSITLRVIGGVGGLVLGALFDDATGLDTSAGAGFWIWIILGWLIGASWAEYRLTRPVAGQAAASLTPREVRDYLPARLYAAPAVASGIVLVLATFGGLAPTPDDPAHPLPPTAGLVAAALGSVVIAGLIVLAVRSVVARRQPTGPPDIVAADDAIRASAVHNLAGGGTAAILLIASQVSFSVFAPRSTGIGLSLWLSVVLAVAAVVAWRWSAYRHWRVRRASTVAVSS